MVNPGRHEPDASGFLIRRATLGDEATLRAIRLRALSDAPDAFGSTYQRELDRTPEEWRKWLAPSATFILEAAGQPSGLAAGVPDRSDPSLMSLMAMWVDPALRGSGAAGQLIAEVLRFAESAGAERVRLDVIDTNEPARRCYERAGFRLSGRTSIRERDGALELEMELETGARRE